MWDDTYEFEVEVADYDDLRRGVTAALRWTGSGFQDYSIVTVSAWAVGFNDVAAWWTAWMMAAAATGKMPTCVHMISFPVSREHGDPDGDRTRAIRLDRATLYR